MIVKLLIKWVLKLLFFGRAAYEISSEEFREKGSAIQSKLSQAEKEGEETYHVLCQRLGNLEEKLTTQLDHFQQKWGSSNGCPTGHSGNGTEVNELRAELAEMRAEIRSLKRQLPTLHDDPA